MTSSTSDSYSNFYENEIPENFTIIKTKNILVVGAGGIGCELLKNLVMSGFKKITIVDLDKVEKSNLNRQFLFDKTCIGKYKSEMAKESILKRRGDNQELNLTSYVGNIKDKTMFSLEFFKSFDLILNALDNIDARTYINQICIQQSIPLVNSGTEGFMGTVGVHIRDKTPCYNCVPKTKQKAIPICSIRSKPEKIEHCVAWAKSLFELLFGENTSGNLLEDYKIDDDSKKNYQNYFFKTIHKEHASNNNAFPIDIEHISQFEFKDINSVDSKNKYIDYNKHLHKYDHDTNFDLNQLIFLLLKSTDNLKPNKFEKFDKENKDIVNFVYSAANLRANNFKIKNETRFKIKEIAGNIIPAIASTNAIIAAVQTIETVKVILNNDNLLRNVNYSMNKKIASVSSVKDEKSQNCVVCSPNALRSVELKINTESFTLAHLLIIIKEKYSIEFPQIYLKGSLLYESGEDLDEDEVEGFEVILRKPIKDIITVHKEFKISDLSQKKEFTLRITHEDSYDINKYDLIGEIQFASDEVVNNEENEMQVEEDPVIHDLDDCQVVEEVPKSENSFINIKRKADEDLVLDEENSSIKKRRIESDNE